VLVTNTEFNWLGAWHKRLYNTQYLTPKSARVVTGLSCGGTVPDLRCIEIFRTCSVPKLGRTRSFFEEVTMQKKPLCRTLMLLLIVVSAAVVLSAPKEDPKSGSADQAEPGVITNSIGMGLVRIPAGEFMKGVYEIR